MNKSEFNIHSIGHIKIANGRFFIELQKEYIDALTELDGFSYIQVVWWCHLLDNKTQRLLTVIDKPYKKAPDKIGIFATRSPMRPNPLAISNAAVLSIDHAKGIIQVPYIDAENGTPVIDIKPYHPATERVRDVKVPEWCAHWPKWYEDSATFNWAAEFENAR
jgi:tRNA (adenine37-N6)-methyltransferase